MSDASENLRYLDATTGQLLTAEDIIALYHQRALEATGRRSRLRRQSPGATHWLQMADHVRRISERDA
jgi:hypothetical protein